MNHHPARKCQNVCPRNCPSSCTMISYVENDRLLRIAGDFNHPYTKGKLCAKGFSYTEKNTHSERLKYPYYQKIKGSGKFIQITWEKAFQLIVSEMLNIYKHFGSFLPFAWFKGSGNIGVHHFVADDFFSSIGETTRLIGSSSLFSGCQTVENGHDALNRFNPSGIKEAATIIIWGANPAATNIHLIPFIFDAKIKGAKIVVIDPLFTQTAELADLYIQLRPGSDGTLACLLIKHLIEQNAVDKSFAPIHSVENHDFSKNMDVKEYLLNCDVSEEAFNLLAGWLTNAKTAAYVVGTGLQKHANFEQTIHSIETLAEVHGDTGKMGGGIYFRRNNTLLFNNQLTKQGVEKNRLLNIHEMSKRNSSPNQHPVQMLWVTCANPLTQEPNANEAKRWLKEIPLVVTVDQFMTPTAQMSNLILPTTTHFEEMDIVASSWHKEIALNERAVSPFYESRSEWRIMTELAERLKQHLPSHCTFPLYPSEEEYLNAQFNEQVFRHYSIRNVLDLKERRMTGVMAQDVLSDRQAYSETKDDQPSGKTTESPSLDKSVLGKYPPKEYPFWLMTPHHPYAFNSQFHFLQLSDETEAFVGIHPKAASALGIKNGDIVKVYNQQACIEIKAVYSKQVAKDIVLIYQGWYPESEININELVTNQHPESGNETAAFFDTFVNVRKL
ncbi:molybdopterin-containing oxidoreductase family protein [Bacillus benzoevorans]|uniref:Anaerobic selenocysteine-containing dehydrogenase n=1 Tax=Bacillus benzoevorans TaxID=1456 RepID=A0A7X0HTK4_9BACI|nr:molybdopterin-dependent oxidoreductase [Bacillus benzoevorans]MBB6446619.1 anaerobic selenocysteine-containing dehydrogenase [Bacillus benzoevorans]